MASTLDITVSSSQILASQIYLKSTNSRYIRGPLILPGVTKCFAIFVQILGVDVTWVLQISNQVPVQSLPFIWIPKVLIHKWFCRFFGPFYGACPIFLGIWSSITGRVFANTTCCHPTGQSQRRIYSPSVMIGQVGLFTFGAYGTCLKLF